MKTRTLGAIALATLSFSLPLSASADVLDQTFTGGAGQQGSVDANAVLSRAQTFTVGVTGTLTRVFLSLAESGTLPEDELTIDIRPTDQDGAPLLDDGTALGTVVVPSGDLGGSLDFENLFELDFTSAHIAVTEGDELAIVARSEIPFGQGRLLAIGAMVGGTYAGGAAWIRTSSWALQEQIPTDLVFQTYVEVPEPANAATAAVLALVALARRRELGRCTR